MINLKPWFKVKPDMRIGELAKAADVTASRIRFYEKRGVLPKAERTANGYREYPDGLVRRLKFIEHAQQLGFTLREIAALENEEGELLVTCTEAIALLNEKLDSVDELIDEAMRRKGKIIELINTLQARIDSSQSVSA